MTMLSSNLKRNNYKKYIKKNNTNRPKNYKTLNEIKYVFILFSGVCDLGSFNLETLHDYTETCL